MSAIKNKETGTKARRNRPDAPIYMPPAIRRSTCKENEPLKRTPNVKNENIKTSVKTSRLKPCPCNTEQEPCNIETNNKTNTSTSNKKIKNLTLENAVEVQSNENNETILSSHNDNVTILSSDHNNVDVLLPNRVSPEIENMKESITNQFFENSPKTDDSILYDKVNNSTTDFKMIKNLAESCSNSEKNKIECDDSKLIIDVNQKESTIDIKREIQKTTLESDKEIIDSDYIDNYNSNTKISVINTSVDIQNSKNHLNQLNIRSAMTENKIIDKNAILQTDNYGNDKENKINKEDNIYSLNAKKNDKETDEDVEEFLRASEGLNRCNKRLVKTSFNKSDILIIEDSGLDEERVDDWEELLDDTTLIETSLFPKPIKTNENIPTSPIKEDCRETKRRSIDNSMMHVIEIFGFPSEFQTRDLLTIFEHYRADTYHIKWVDDNHALGIFATENIAQDVLKIQHPLIKLRPMSEASKQAIAKVKKNPNAMMPVMARPQTCPQTARRMVTGALGLKMKSSKEDREKEKQILKEAREKKRLAIRQQDDAWEGRISSLN